MCIRDSVNSQYGNLVFYRKNFYDFTSFEWAVEKLREDKSTRKALVLYNDKDFFFSSNRDLICNQYQNFLIRDNELKCFVHLRSSDAIFGLTFNIPWWSLVHQQLYLTLLKDYPDLRLGSILASIDSSHIYENKFELVENMLDSPIKEDRFLRLKKIIPLGKSFEFYKNEVFTEERDEYFENVI